MKPHELISHQLNIRYVRERATVLAISGNKFDAELLLKMSDIIQQQSHIIEALMADQGAAYAQLKAVVQSTGWPEEA